MKGAGGDVCNDKLKLICSSGKLEIVLQVPQTNLVFAAKQRENNLIRIINAFICIFLSISIHFY